MSSYFGQAHFSQIFLPHNVNNEKIHYSTISQNIMPMLDVGEICIIPDILLILRPFSSMLNFENVVW